VRKADLTIHEEHSFHSEASLTYHESNQGLSIWERIEAKVRKIRFDSLCQWDVMYNGAFEHMKTRVVRYIKES